MSSHIATLIDAGADAMTNMFEVGFSFKNATTAQLDKMKIRVKGFTPPAPSQSTYDVHWKTVSIKKASTKIELDRTLEFEIRIDAYYQVYKELLKWHAQTMDATTGYAANDAKTGGIITVKALTSPIENVNSAGNAELTTGVAPAVMTWQFTDVWISSITSPTYGTDSAEPGMASVKFVYGNYTLT